MFPDVNVVVCARNEEQHLPSTLTSLFAQTVKSSKVVVVDDGSIDHTFEVASLFGCCVVRLPFHRDSFVGRPELAMRFNVGLSKVSDATDYVLILGADSILPSDYVEKLLQKFKDNVLLKVASGCILNETHDAIQPRGSGRLIDAKWWRSINGLRFPVVFGWEAWLQYKAMASGYEAKSFRDLPFKVTRKSGHNLKQSEYHGYSMNALGYFWPFALARCVSQGPKYGRRMFVGWVKGRNLQRLDVANYVSMSQRTRFISKTITFLKRDFALS